MRVNIQSGGDFEDVHGYCRAVRVGDHLHVAGTTARDPAATLVQVAALIDPRMKIEVEAYAIDPV